MEEEKVGGEVKVYCNNTSTESANKHTYAIYLEGSGGDHPVALGTFAC